MEMIKDLLFDVPVQPSPRLRWLQEHKITTAHWPEVNPGDEDEFGNELFPWTAFCGPLDGLHATIGCGATEAEALADYARQRGIRLWNEEGYEKPTTH